MQLSPLLLPIRSQRDLCMWTPLGLLERLLLPCMQLTNDRTNPCTRSLPRISLLG